MIVPRRADGLHPSDQTDRDLHSLMLQAIERLWGGPPQVWGSGGNRLRMRMCIVGWAEFLSVAGTKRAIVDRAANLEQEIGPSSRPAHLLGFIHSAVHQKIGCPLGDRGPNPQPGTTALGIIDHPVALAGEIAIQRVQGGPQLS